MIKNKRAAGNPNPVYFKLQKELQHAIESGRWAPGERVPPEKMLAGIHKVSVGTVTKAILNLVSFHPEIPQIRLGCCPFTEMKRAMKDNDVRS